jgi:hypothetical protein
MIPISTTCYIRNQSRIHFPVRPTPWRKRKPILKCVAVERIDVTTPVEINDRVKITGAFLLQTHRQEEEFVE